MNINQTVCSNQQNRPLPYESVGLPDPLTVELEDANLLRIYRDFCSTLYFGPSEEVVMADAEFFHCDSDSLDSRPDVLTKLKLLCALLRPTKKVLKKILARTYDTETFRNTQGRFTGHVYNFGIGRAVRCLEEFRETPDYKVLRKPAAPFEYIDCLSSELASAPGITWLARLEMCTWSSNWGMTLYYGDSEDSQDEAFPKVIGFFKLQDYPRHAAFQLTEIEYFHVPDEAYVYGNELLALCWMRGGDDSSICLGRHLLELDELTLARLTKDYGGLYNGRFISDAQRIREYAGEHLDIDWEENSLKPMFEHYGYQGVMNIIAAIKEEERKEREKVLNKRIDRDSRRLRQTQRIYDLVDPLAPDQFPNDQTVMELTPEQEQSLRKWMQERLNLKDCVITHGSHYDGKTFIVSFMDDRGRETREFVKRDGVYPLVQEAFRQLFASFYEGHECPVCSAGDIYWIDYLFDEEDGDEEEPDDSDEAAPPVTTETYYAQDDVSRFLNNHERWQVQLRYSDVNSDDTELFCEAEFHCGSCGHNWKC